MKDQIKRILDISHHLNWNSKPKMFTHYNFPVLCLNSKMYNGEIKIQGYPVSVSVSAQNGRNTVSTNTAHYPKYLDQFSINLLATGLLFVRQSKHGVARVSFD